MVAATTSTSLSASTDTSPSPVIVNSYVSCAWMLGTATPAASKSSARVEDVPTSKASTNGVCVLKSTACRSCSCCIHFSSALHKKSTLVLPVLSEQLHHETF